MKLTKRRIFMVFVIMPLGVYILWLWCQPVKIMAVHHNGNYNEVLVRNYPFTDEGKIKWWLKNKEMLKERYNIPKPDEDGWHYVILWDFGDGYKEEGKYDRLCFDDMSPPVNCIDKNKKITITHYKNHARDFTVSGGVYTLHENGLIVKRKTD